MIRLNIEGNDYQFKSGITLEEIINSIDHPEKDIIVAAIVNNKVRGLSYNLEKDSIIIYLTRAGILGNRIYRRSLLLVLVRAVYKLYPEANLDIQHSLSNGLYCELYKDTTLDQYDINNIREEMQKLVTANLPITRRKLSREKALAIYQKQGFDDKVALISQSDKEQITVYEFDGFYDYFCYHMVPRSGYLDTFDLHFRYPGFILLFPRRDNPRVAPDFVEQPKLASIFLEYEKLGDILGVSKVTDLNQREPGELIRIAEALHEKNIARIADRIDDNIDSKRIILIAGPTSSGKTTFTHRLSIQLKINGLRPVAISVDDYFVNRGNTPRDEDGNYDFEALEAIDRELLNNHLVRLLQGEKVEIPTFNFKTGKRKYRGRYLQLDEDQPILIEGIHGLNDRLTPVIPRDHKFKIYISALTQLNIDRHNRIPTTDTRLIRRIIRDNEFRGHKASTTISWWSSVRRGEEKNIFPYQENADAMFNSALIYELAVLKPFIVPLLEKINKNQTEYYEARRLLEVLEHFQEIAPDDIPNTSILREFVGGSVFREV
ncbi:MAG: nucleoside kinase [Halanaerobiaceae bacterium]